MDFEADLGLSYLNFVFRYLKWVCKARIIICGGLLESWTSLKGTEFAEKIHSPDDFV